MKNNQLAVMLMLVLFASAALNIWYAYRFVRSSHHLERLQPVVARVNESRNLVQSLLADTVEYGKKNSAINPVLQSFFHPVQLPSTAPSSH